MTDTNASKSNKRRALGLVLLALGGVVLALVVGEIVARVVEDPVDKLALHETLLERPYLYGLRPTHPEVSSQRLRDREFEIPKPVGTTRIMLLGDSVVYGVGVARDQTLSRQLETRLRTTHPGVEVMNAGVHGWSPYNQRQYFATDGRALEPDVVVCVFCLNDVANPHLHWRYSDGLIASIPDAAVPNLEYYETHAKPVLARQLAAQQARQSFPRSWLRRSALYRIAAEFLRTKVRRPFRVLAGRRWPLRITGEDSISIDVLLDRESAEWTWLAEQYRALAASVREAGATLVIASVPLAYQLDPHYPYEPQTVLGEFCESIGVSYAPALPTLRGQDPDAVFLGERSGYDDIWHLSPDGLGRVADGLAAHLRETALSR